jgi:hypothetical protein
MTTALATLADNIRALTEPLIHLQPFEIQSIYVPGSKDIHGRNYAKRIHKSTHASLLDQLRTCVYDRPQTEQEAANREAITVPHVDEDAIDRIMAIEDATAKWLTELDINSRAKGLGGEINRTATRVLSLFPDRRQIPKEVIRACALLRAGSADVARLFDIDLPALVGAAAANDDPGLGKQLAADTGRWATWCRIFAGWEDPPWRPRARCPHCEAATGVDADSGQPSGLRVRTDIRSAVCLTCDSTWSDDEGGVRIEVLAAHIKATAEAPLSAEQLAALVDPGKAMKHQNRGGTA